MNRDRLEGRIRNLRGRAKTAAGAVRGDPRQQFEGAFEQAAGAAQQAFGRARETAHDLRREGIHFVEEGRQRVRSVADEARSRTEFLASEARERGRHARSLAVQRGQQIARQADENRAATVALVALLAFGVGWLMRPSRQS